MDRKLKRLKTIQYLLYAFSVFLLILQLVCIWESCLEMGVWTHQKILRSAFLGISDSVWEQGLISFLLVLQAGSLIGFFGIAAYVGIKILSTPLSNAEQKEIVHSPYDAFNKMIFSKILFGLVTPTTSYLYDMRNAHFRRKADLYLFHFKLSNKAYGLIFLAVLAFVVPVLWKAPVRAPGFQLILSFIYLNLSLLVFLELILFCTSTLYKGRHDDE